MKVGCVKIFSFVLLLITFGVMQLEATCQGVLPTRLSVVLDRKTFPESTYANMQDTANQVADIVNTLIPGIPAGYAQPNVLCYRGALGVPQTTFGPIRPTGYPLDRPLEQVRIGLSNTTEKPEMLAFQLAHELTHVKMGAKNDNYMVELFAVAVQLEVLRRLKFTSMLASEFTEKPVGMELSWPPDVYVAILWRDDSALAKYWQSKEIHQQHLNHTNWDYSLASVGALVLQAHGQIDWPKLLDIADLSSDCHPMGEGLWTQDCQPAMARLLVREPVLKSLGYSQAISN